MVLVVRIWSFHCHGPGLVPGRGTEIPQAMRHGQNKKNKTTSSILHTYMHTYIKGSEQVYIVE